MDAKSNKGFGLGISIEPSASLSEAGIPVPSLQYAMLQELPWIKPGEQAPEPAKNPVDGTSSRKTMLGSPADQLREMEAHVVRLWVYARKMADFANVPFAAAEEVAESHAALSQWMTDIAGAASRQI